MKTINIKSSRHIKLMVLIAFSVHMSSCVTHLDTSNDLYTYQTNDPNGIGKWYMGREIASVMGFEGMEWLERPEREAEENASTLLKNMNIKSQDTIADIGAGSGYHVFRMTPKAAKGLIYAVDIQKEMLSKIESRKINGRIQNIEIILGSEKSTNLPENTVDKIILVDVYHEFNYPYEMMQSIKKALKPDGEVFLIEYRGEDFRVPIKEIHKMTEKQAIKEMKAVGFKLKQNIENLPWQHCMIFIKS